ncbi:nuclear pore complex protein Nup85-like [Argopecten irradians]|uniref:nuclear pore complex protein Nup85-like n=1 Tax=Argopecten irradians TaxID=31199 RepID=UPI003710DE68
MAEREREPHFCAINDLSCSQGLQAVWGCGNQFFVFPGKKAILLNDRQPVLMKEEMIREVRWDMDLHKPVLRKLVNESHNLFTCLQEQAKTTSGAALHPHIIRSSKQYRAALKAYSLELKILADSTINEEQKQDFLEHLQLLEMSELIWGLCEILFIDSLPGGLVIAPLLDWLRFHFQTGEQMFLEIIQEDQPEHHPLYWDTVYRLVLQGQTDNVRRLLSLHSSKHSAAFTSMDDLLRKMPQHSQLLRGHSAAEFDMKWRHWRDECERRLEEGEFSSYGNLETIGKILMGNDQVFSELRDLSETWYHMLVSKLLYQNPTIKGYDLQYHIQGCLDEYRSNARIGELDNILLSALEYDIHQVIKDSSAMFSNWWFVAHLTDLLQHCGQLDSHKLQFGSNLREFLLLEYATSLMSHKSLWIVGVGYLDHCPEFGRKHLEHFMENISIESEKKAQKLLHICQERNLVEQAKSICKVMGRRHMQYKRLGAALTWFLKSKDVALSTVIAERFLFEYSEKGSFSNLDLIDNLGPSMLLSNRLTFLGKYREFHKLYEEKEFEAAGQLLLSLLQARLAPKQFWVTLLVDAMPLLEAEKVIFSSAQTFDLMHCLEELMREFKDIDVREKEKLALLRLALTRNLSRAIVTEGTVRLT